MNERDDAIQLLVAVADDGPVADRERVGVVELDPIDRDTGTADLAVWIHPDKRRDGYAREALELTLAYAFAERRVHKVTANAYATNEASRGLLEAVGFVEEGVGREDAFVDGAYRDTHYFGLLRREWDDGTDSAADD
jgi:RimJ/RimL family protein N-acetyltransferase